MLLKVESSASSKIYFDNTFELLHAGESVLPHSQRQY